MAKKVPNIFNRTSLEKLKEEAAERREREKVIIVKKYKENAIKPFKLNVSMTE